MLTVAFAISLFISSCSKSSSSSGDPQTNPTILTITVEDSIGNVIPGAAVNVYADSSDYANQSNVITTGTSDATGAVSFPNLAPIAYYFSVTDGCMNNHNKGIRLTSAETPYINTKVNVVIAGTGTLKYVNNSSNPYTVYVNGYAPFIVNGNTTASSSSYVPTGTYSIRVVQNSGYLITPTDETFTGTLSCGGTLTTTFP